MSMAPISPSQRGVSWVDPHFAGQWRARTDPEDRPGYNNPLALWEEAADVDVPHARPPAYARFHVPTETILIGRWGWLKTAVPLWHRPPTERRYVREQLEDSDL